MTKLIFGRRATRHLDAIYDHIARDNPSAAQSVIDRIHEVANNIEMFPEIGRKTVLRDVQVFPVTPYPYVIYFRVGPRRDEVRILAIRHTARRRPGLQEDERAYVA